MHQLLSATSADRYVEAMRETVDRLAGRLRDTAQPFSGASRGAAPGRWSTPWTSTPRSGHARRRCARPTTSSASTRSGSTTRPTRRTSTARSRCRRWPPRRSSRRSTRRSTPTTSRRSARSWSASWSTGRAGGSGSRAGDGVFTSGGTQSNLQALLLARETAIAARRGHGAAARTSRAGSSSSPPRRATSASQKSARLLGLGDDAVLAGRAPTRTAGWTRPRWRGRCDTLAAIDRVPMCVVATAGTTDRGRLDPLAPIADECDRAGVVAARRRRVRVRAAGLADAPAPAGRHRAGAVGHGRLPQELLPAGVVQRGARARAGRPAARHLARGLPQPARTPRSPTRWTSRCRRPAGSTRSSCGPRCARWAPTASGRCSTRSCDLAARVHDELERDVDFELRRPHRAEHRPVPLPAGRRHGRAGRPPGAAGAARAVRVGARGRRQDRGGRAAVPQAHAAQPRARRSTTCARCSTWSAARLRRWSRATTWSAAAEVGAL